MPKYKVRLTAYVETTQIVEADDEEQACELLEEEWGQSWVVHNTVEKSYRSFDDILAYDPEEVDGGADEDEDEDEDV